MGQADGEEGFRVTDRRGRTDTEAAPSPTPEASRSTPPGRESEGRAQGTRAREGRPPTERTLAGLFVMLASSAAIALGDAPDPVSGERAQDLGQAAELIDLLVLLREKTEGHRTDDESRILEGLIYDLQLRYVSATKRS